MKDTNTTDSASGQIKKSRKKGFHPPQRLASFSFEEIRVVVCRFNADPRRMIEQRRAYVSALAQGRE